MWHRINTVTKHSQRDTKLRAARAKPGEQIHKLTGYAVPMYRLQTPQELRFVERIPNDKPYFFGTVRVVKDLVANLLPQQSALWQIP
jgi:hypothetical protein